MKNQRSTCFVLGIMPLALAAASASAAGIDADGVDDSVDACVNTPAGIPVTADGRPLGDIDLDCDCDLVDFALFATSFTGPLTAAESCADGVDNDGDGFIDCADVSGCPSGTACAAHASCAASACACDAPWDDCDGASTNGCEADLLADSAHCGACFNPCTNAHGTTACAGGVCDPECVGLWGDCDGDVDNGCESSLSTLTHCGACLAPCSLANATESCSTGSCQIAACNSGWCNQNGAHGDGCEFDLDTNPGCGSATNLGVIPGDTGASSVAPSGYGERWFRVYISEEDNNPFSAHDLCARIQLLVPAGTNYDLFAYCDGCASVAASSTNAGSTTELVYVRWEETLGSDSGRDVYIRVAFVDGGTCADYTLTVTGNQCVGPDTCSQL
jgi:hypothetical protein